MYRITCDGFPLLDWRDNDLIVVNPEVKLEVNTVGEGSFTIYKNHPYYDKLKKLKSVFEVSDEYGIIFRGRATGDTGDFDHGMTVDLEGAMAYFNDSTVRPFAFPGDFTNNAAYIAAAESGNVVEFFLSWLINQHNKQTQPFQHFRLGNVTVSDPNNYITRSSTDYSTTWGTLKSKLFESSLGGYLCIRYEENGNFIDYLASFEETNEQEIVYGENLLDLSNETVSTETYSAIIPIGKDGLTISDLPDGDITEDIVKSGDTLYSKSGRDAFGWICAPTSETKWDDVTQARNLLTNGVEWLSGRLVMKNSIEATAVDLHFTDSQIRSLRIYKNVNVYSEPHGLTENFPLSKLEIDLLNPQNTKIKVGKTILPLTEKTTIQQEEISALVAESYSKLEKSSTEILAEVGNIKGEVTTLLMESGKVNVSVTDENGTLITTIDASTWEAIRKNLVGETTSGFYFDFELGRFVYNGTGVFTSADGETYIEIDGGELVLYSTRGTDGEALDKIRMGYITGPNPSGTGTIDYPYMMFGKSNTTEVGLIKKFVNGFWMGNSSPLDTSGNFEGVDGAAGIFVNTKTGQTYAVEGTKMRNIYSAAEGEMNITSGDVAHNDLPLSDCMPVCLTLEEYEALVAAGTYNPNTPYLIKKEA